MSENKRGLVIHTGGEKSKFYKNKNSNLNTPVQKLQQQQSENASKLMISDKTGITMSSPQYEYRQYSVITPFISPYKQQVDTHASTMHWNIYNNPKNY